MDLSSFFPLPELFSALLILHTTICAYYGKIPLHTQNVKSTWAGIFTAPIVILWNTSARNMPITRAPHDARDSCHQVCFTSTASTQVVTQVEKWPDRAPTTTHLCCRTKMVPNSWMGNQPQKQMALSESRIEIRSVHRNISVWGQTGIWERAIICCARAPRLLIQLPDGLTFFNFLNLGKSFDGSLLLPWSLCLFSIQRKWGLQLWGARIFPPNYYGPVVFS